MRGESKMRIRDELNNELFTADTTPNCAIILSLHVWLCELPIVLFWVFLLFFFTGPVTAQLKLVPTLVRAIHLTPERERRLSLAHSLSH